MIVLDIETTGTNPEKHSIIQIGAINFERPELIFNETCRVWDEAHLDPDALKYTGMTEEIVKDPSNLTEEEIVKKLFAWIEEQEERTIMGMHPSFDTGFLQAASHRYKINFPLAKRTIDMHTLVYMHMIKRGVTPPIAHGHSAINSDQTMEYVGIPAEPKPHIAINGATWEAEAFSRLLFDKPLLSQFEKYHIPWLTNN